MVLQERNWSVGSGYRYGLNGMENVDEVYGNDASVDFGSRIYDTRLGRWSSIDPHDYRYPNISPYCFAFNSPLYLIDADGNDIYYFDANNNLTAVIHTGTSDDVVIRLTCMVKRPQDGIQEFNGKEKL